MIPIKINNFEVLVKSNISFLEACDYIGITIPRFCYHEILSIAGNCRMCLIELENSEKPIASCVTLVGQNLSIFTNSPAVKKARENVVESLLINHPLDCPICDQAGECDLQDQARNFGSNFSRFQFKKRSVEDKNCGPFIKTIMTRCIHCTRCVRFCNEIAGTSFFTTLNRGTFTEIGHYNSKIFFSEISGNVIDLCPVGALTAKNYSFVDRPWKEEKLIESIDLTDSTGSNIYVKYHENNIIKIVPKYNSFINGSLISDKARFSFDGLSNLIKIIGKKDNVKEIISKCEILLKLKQKLLILVSGEISLQNLEILKLFEKKNFESVKIRAIEKDKQKNICIPEIKNPFRDINITFGNCFLLSSSIKLESSVLNARLRWEYIHEKKILNFYSFNRIFDHNIPTTFVNLNTKHLISFFEGKKILSFSLFNSEKSLLILGDSLKKSFFDISNLISLIKSKFPNVKIIKLNSCSNSESLKLLNIKNFSRQDRFWTSNHNIVSFNLTNYQIQLTHDFSIGFNFEKWFQWFGSNKMINQIGPFKQEEIHINSEGRPQNASFFVKPKNDEIQKFYCKSQDYIHELLTSQKVFNFFQSNIVIKDRMNCLFFKEKMNVKFFPVKSDLERYYCSNEFTKRSINMQKMEKVKIKQSINFPND
jgi:NADH dehydrogenase/NADH:ubiquinone oxidoreductase subunit G